MPYRDPAGGKAVLAAHGKGFDLLLGRRTYDIWAGYWPKAKNSPLADSMNAATKYVAIHRPDSLGWGPVRGPWTGHRRRHSPHQVEGRPDLIAWGSSTLTSMLLEHGLADEVLLLVYPILLGNGKRSFSDGTPHRKLALTGTKAVSSGVIIRTYTPTGPLRTGSFDDVA